MDKTNLYKVLAVAFLLSILFTPENSRIWFYFFIPGLVFGILWFRKLS